MSVGGVKADGKLPSRSCRDRHGSAWQRGTLFGASDQRIIRPLQKRLPLPRAAGPVAGFAIGAHLCFVPSEGPPSFDLERVDVGDAPAQIVAAIPRRTDHILIIISKRTHLTVSKFSRRSILRFCCSGIWLSLAPCVRWGISRTTMTHGASDS